MANGKLKCSFSLNILFHFNGSFCIPFKTFDSSMVWKTLFEAFFNDDSLRNSCNFNINTT